jgi:hypothetical protein
MVKVRKIYINGKLYDGSKLPIETDNKMSLATDIFEELTPEQRQQGYTYGDILVINE